MIFFKKITLAGVLVIFCLLGFSLSSHSSEIVIKSKYKSSVSIKKCDKGSDKGVDYFYLNTIDKTWSAYKDDGDEDDGYDEGDEYGSYFETGKNKLAIVMDEGVSGDLISELFIVACDSDVESTTGSPFFYKVKFNKNKTSATIKAKGKISGYDYDFDGTRSGKYNYSGKGKVTEYDDSYYGDE